MTRRALASRGIAFALLAGCSAASSAGSTSGDTDAPAPTPPPGSSAVDAGESNAATATSAAADANAARLFVWLEGTFDSTEQSRSDSAYLAISLVACRVAVPELGARVLYVEQARVGGAPYRQRLYVVEAVSASSARSRVFEPADPAPLRGLCAAAPPRPLRAADFAEREGCAVEMHWTGPRYEGSTPDARWTGERLVPAPEGPRCSSSLNGASYVSSEVTVRSDGLRAWDRGFDATGQQVWGAVKGGYEFVRRTPLRDP